MTKQERALVKEAETTAEAVRKSRSLFPLNEACGCMVRALGSGYSRCMLQLAFVPFPFPFCLRPPLGPPGLWPWRLRPMEVEIASIIR